MLTHQSSVVDSRRLAVLHHVRPLKPSYYPKRPHLLHSLLEAERCHETASQRWGKFFDVAITIFNSCKISTIIIIIIINCYYYYYLLLFEVGFTI